jgi:hypothetical protein
VARVRARNVVHFVRHFVVCVARRRRVSEIVKNLFSP